MHYFDIFFILFLIAIFILARGRYKKYQEHMDKVEALAQESNELLKEIKDLIKAK